MYTKQRWFFYGTVFITGMAVLVIEIAATRILAPHYGSSTFVFSGILTVILAALSCGYYVGGRLSDKMPHTRPLYGIIAISGLSVLFIQVIENSTFQFAKEVFTSLSGPLFLSLALFFIPAFLLGIVSPYIIKLASLHSAEDAIGTTAGLVFFWGTLGSIVGSLLGGFYLIPMLGVALSIRMVGISLIGLALLGMLVQEILEKGSQFFVGLKRQALFYVGIVLIAIMLLATRTEASVFDGKVIYEGEGLYSHILVYEGLHNGKPMRALKRDTNNSSASYIDSDRLVFGYTKFARLYPHLVDDAKDYLLIGGGAYSIPRSIIAEDENITMDVVELEPSLFALAQKYFGLDDVSRINNYPMDGRVFINQTEKKYDVVFEDAFSAEMSMPVHLVTKEFYETVQSRMKENGVLIVNYIGALEHVFDPPTLTGSVIKTLQSVFPQVRMYAFRKEDPTALQNIIFIARNGTEPIDLHGVTIINSFGQLQRVPDMEVSLSTFNMDDEIELTDDRAPLEFLWLKQ